MLFVLTDANLPATLNSFPMADNEFANLCADHPDLTFEMTAEGELIVMAPAFPGSAARNSRITRHLDVWAEQNGHGFAFDSSCGYVLPNGARRSPDASWVLKSRIQQIRTSGEDGFLHLYPDFAIELRSDTDRLKSLQEKMREYVSVGTPLGWLIDPQKQSVSIYRPNMEPEIRENIDSIAGEGILETFTLPLAAIWSPFGD